MKKQKSTSSLEELLSDPYFEKYVHEPDSENTAFWENWLKNNPQHQKTFSLAQDIIKASDYHKNIPNLDAQKLYHEIETGIEIHSKRNYQKRIWLYSGVAASVLILITFSFLYFFNSSINQFLEYQTPLGETQQISLPDGSKVILNANSYLRFYTNWQSEGQREVYLEGEAFFEVKKISQSQEKIKFLVNTADVQVEVLGTEFNVNTRQANSQVVLASGRIRLSHRSNPNPEAIILAPGEMASFDTQVQGFKRQSVAVETYIAWKDHQFIFKDTPLAEVAQIIEDNFGYKVTIQDSILLEEKLVGTFPNDDIEILLETLRATVQVEIQNKQIILKQKK